MKKKPSEIEEEEEFALTARSWRRPSVIFPTIAVVVLLAILVLPLVQDRDRGSGKEVTLFSDYFDDFGDGLVRVARRLSGRADTGDSAGRGKWSRTTFYTDDGLGHSIEVRARFGVAGKGDPVSLAVVCTKTGFVDVSISWSAARYLKKDGGDGAGWKHVTTNVAGSESTSQWDLTKDRRSTFAPDPQEFVNSLRHQKSFQARIVGSSWATFETEGMDSALSSLRDGCGVAL